MHSIKATAVVKYRSLVSSHNLKLDMASNVTDHTGAEAVTID